MSESPYCTSVPKLQYAWDNTTLSMFKTCPRKYELAQLEGWISKHPALPLDFGIALHDGMEKLQRLLIEGRNRDEALVEAMRKAWTSAWNSSIKTSPENNRTIKTLLRTICWHADQYVSDGMETVRLDNGKAAVELSFRLELPLENPDGGAYLYCGHIDRLAVYQGAIFVVDYKHTARAVDTQYFAKYTPDGQMSGYTLAAKTVVPGKVQGCLVDAAQVGVTFSRFARGFANRSEGQLDEFLRDTIEWIKYAEHCARQQYWPMNTESCDKYGGCIFRQICSKDPAVRRTFLQAEFNQRVWNPLQSRGE